MTSSCLLIFVTGMKSSMAGSPNLSFWLCVCSADHLPNEINKQDELFAILQAHLFMKPLSGQVGWKHLGEDFYFCIDLLFCKNIRVLFIG